MSISGESNEDFTFWAEFSDGESNGESAEKTEEAVSQATDEKDSDHLNAQKDEQP